MRKLNEVIDRFCALHPRLGLPGLMRYIIGANVITYFLDILSNGALYFLAMDARAVLRGEIWRLVTYVLLPSSDGIMLLIACLFYYWLGTSLEQIWGSAKFTVYYISGTLLTSLACLIAYLIDGFAVPLYGAGYVNTALFFAYALYNPDAMVRIYFIIPIKMKWLAWFEAALYAVSVIQYALAGLWGMALVPVAAVFNLFVYFSPSFHRRADAFRMHRRPQAIQFRQAVKKQQKQKGYNHKCAVCGKTDTEYPDMQFRYCSRCQGYHCFCEEHIFNHVHFTE